MKKQQRNPTRNQQSNPAMKRLQDYIRQQLKHYNYSLREAARRSGGYLSHATLFNIMAGRVNSIDDRTFEGLARCFATTRRAIQDVWEGRTDGSIQSETQQMEIRFRLPVLELLNQDAIRCGRSLTEQLDAILVTYFRLQDVNITAIPELPAGILPALAPVKIVSRTPRLPRQEPIATGSKPSRKKS